MTTTLPPITPKQQEILRLLYKYRFLNRTQIQTLLSHKDKRRIITWLKDLREKEYIDWQYDPTNFIAKSQPAIYYLSLNGIRHLRSLNEYPTAELRKRYKESTRTQVFTDRCLLIADCCIALIAKNDDEVQYAFTLPADYIHPNHPQHRLNELKPHLYLSKHRGSDMTEYLVENFEQTLPRYQLKKRLKDYVEYFNDSDTDSLVVLLACASTADLLYAKRSVRKLIDDSNELLIRVTTLDKLKASGITSTIWEEI
jgi:protein involved in plasmid replication-relaxation